ncbi:unnamed protein product [Porites lobata]|uniref:Nuclease HARBI1 n=1 Tax=Porites lobata TaxID=104759 RepID=A0ABN8N5Y6_9CNID|nr:unnamed protein product [Porites lobata]
MKQWKKVAGTIITCCILHNTCLEVNDATEIGVVSDEDGFPRVLLPEHDSNADGVGLRNTIEDTLYYCFHIISDSSQLASKACYLNGNTLEIDPFTAFNHGFKF